MESPTGEIVRIYPLPDRVGAVVIRRLGPAETRRTVLRSASEVEAARSEMESRRAMLGMERRLGLLERIASVFAV